jgi:hypothetical protein
MVLRLVLLLTHQLILCLERLQLEERGTQLLLAHPAVRDVQRLSRQLCMHCFAWLRHTRDKLAAGVAALR